MTERLCRDSVRLFEMKEIDGKMQLNPTLVPHINWDFNVKEYKVKGSLETISQAHYAAYLNSQKGIRGLRKIADTLSIDRYLFEKLLVGWGI